MKLKPAVWLPAGALTAVIVGAGACGISAALEKRAANGARREIQTQTDLLNQRRREVESLTARQATLQENAERMETLKSGIAGLEAENAELKKTTEQQKNAWQAERDSFSGDIESMRKSLQEKPAARVALQDGDNLKQVRFKSLQGTVVVLEHSDGIAKVQAAMLPEDYRTRLAADWNPALPADLEDPEKLMRMAAAAEAKAAAESEQTVPVTSGTGAAQPSNVAAYLALESKIQAFEAKIEQATATRKNQRNIYEEYTEKHKEARTRGQRSTHSDTANAALNRADLLAGQIAEAQTQLRKMQEELTRLKLPSQQ